MTHALALAGVLTISFSAVWVRLAAVEPDTSAFFRCAYALPFLALLWRLRERSKPSRRARLMAFSSGILLGLDLVFWHRAIEWIGAGLATVLGNTQVLFVALAAWWLHGERPRRIAAGALPVAFLGMLLVSGLGRPGAYGTAPYLGTVAGLATGITYAAFLLLFRAAGRNHGSTVGALLDATLGAALATLAVGVGSGHLEVSLHWPAHGWLLTLALGSQVIGWLLIAYALPRLPALETSALLLLQPLATVLWAWLLFAERLSTVQWSGVALLLGGIGAMSVGGAVEGRAGSKYDRARLP